MNHQPCLCDPCQTYRAESDRRFADFTRLALDLASLDTNAAELALRNRAKELVLRARRLCGKGEGASL
jgi:hypothetical protein